MPSTKAVLSSRQSAFSCTPVSSVDSTSKNLAMRSHLCGRIDRVSRLPLEFWRILHSEYGIVVYPSAFTEDIEIQGLGMDVTFTEAYHGHIGKLPNPLICIRPGAYTCVVMFGSCCGSTNPPPCPFEILTEPPPVYQKETPKVEAPKLDAPKVA